MEEIAYDIPLHYPLPPKNVEWGEVCTHARMHVEGQGPFSVFAAKHLALFSFSLPNFSQYSAPSSDFLFREATHPSTFSAALGCKPTYCSSDLNTNHAAINLKRNVT